MDERGPSRRAMLRGGLAALAAVGASSWLDRAAKAAPFFRDMSLADRMCNPIAPTYLGPSETIGGLPFAAQWFGDYFPPNALPFHTCENCREFPDAEETRDVVIAGGGLSGLASAYFLRHRNPLLLELRLRLGGNAMGESLARRAWSLGSAYFMQADAKSTLGALYTELGVDHEWRQDSGGFSFEYDGSIGSDLLGPTPTQDEIDALARYRDAVAYFAGDAYPELPYERAVPRSVSELDARTFAEDLALRCGTLPPRLAYLLQAYCYSSLGVGAGELSAAAAWNFIAAEEFGRNVMVAGNAGLARTLWQKARRGGADFRCSALVAEIKPVDGGNLVYWRDRLGRPRTIFARQVVLANSKHIARAMLPWLAASDAAKHEAMQQVPTVAYVVVNLLLKRPLRRDFYDIYLNGSAAFPMDGTAFEQNRAITDAVNGGFMRSDEATRVLTLYWPLPWHTARFTIVDDNDWRAYAALAAPQVMQLLATLGVPERDVVQIRLARWGHAMPYAGPGTYTGGLPQELRRPLNGNIWFVNQDNWLLPAVETCLTEAMWAAPQIDAALG